MSTVNDYRRSRRLLSLTIIFFWASEYCHAPYFTPYLETLGFAASTIGFITGAYGFTQMLVRIPPGVATDATVLYTVVQVVGAGFALLTLSAALVGYAASVWLICLSQLIAGFANLMLNAVLMSMVVRWTPQEKQSTAMGLYQAIYGLGMSAGPVAVGALLSVGTFRSAYLWGALFMALAALASPLLIGRASKKAASNFAAD